MMKKLVAIAHGSVKDSDSGFKEPIAYFLYQGWFRRSFKAEGFCWQRLIKCHPIYFDIVKPWLDGGTLDESRFKKNHDGVWIF